LIVRRNWTLFSPPGERNGEILVKIDSEWTLVKQETHPCASGHGSSPLRWKWSNTGQTNQAAKTDTKEDKRS
jgi:hypothetical protein